jgi:hypothetical protein
MEPPRLAELSLHAECHTALLLGVGRFHGERVAMLARSNQAAFGKHCGVCAYVIQQWPLDAIAEASEFLIIFRARTFLASSLTAGPRSS